MKKLISLVLAIMMVAVVGLAFAEDTAGSNTSEWRGSGDTVISISGLTKGDSVKFYQVLAYDENATGAVAEATDVTKGAGSWKAIAPFTSMSLDDFKAILTSGISAEIGGRIGAMATGTVSPVAVGDEGVASVSSPAAGLYVAIITPADPTVIYNPVFVGADYYTNDSGKWVVTADMSYDPTALAKKETINLTKEITGEGDTKYDVNVGDDVNFVISSKVPAYSTTYQNPSYVLTDTLDDGLILKGTPTVTFGSLTMTAGTDYTVAPAADNKSFTVTMTAAGLAKVTGKGTAETITVTYTATVTSIENANVNEKDNTATVQFSNNPGDSTSYTLLEDRTRTYTFSLDANLLGHTGWENSEIVKIGMDAAGNEITKETLSNGTEAGVLPGAEFGLYKDESCTELYTNTVFTTGKVTSDAKGKLLIQGLDAGTYYLKEISAPDGYIKSQDTYKIEITTQYEDVSAGSYENDDHITVHYEAYRILKSYDVKVTNLATKEAVNSGFTITNEGTYNKTATAASESDATSKIANTRGVELPSTGGIGTTIFYIVGGLLLVGAAIVLVARRKAHE